MRTDVRLIVLSLALVAVACRCPFRSVRAPDAGRGFEIPELADIAIDGKALDWGDGGFRVDVLASPGERREPTRDFDAAVRLGWDAKGLLVLATVTDDVPVEYEEESALWRRDSVELFLAPAVGARDVWQAVAAPGVDPKHPKLRFCLYDYRKTETLKSTKLSMEMAGTKTDTGYTLEARLPWAGLGIGPAAGREIGFQVLVNDADGPADRAQLRWFPQDAAHRHTSRMHRLRLAERAGPAVMAVAAGSYERFRRTRIRVAATMGKAATVADGRREIGSARLTARGRLKTADVLLPMPPRGRPYGPLTVLIDGRPEAVVEVPNADHERQRAFGQAEMRFEPCVFSGEAFPAVRFVQPSLVEDLIGPYALRTTFYDADHNTVAAAKKPGRYGAIVEIQPKDGEPTKRFFTLFRQPRRLRWRRHELKLTVELPPELGIKPEVVEAHGRTVADYLKSAIVGSFHHDPDSSVVLAGLYETTPGTPPTRRTGPWARNAWWWHKLKRKTGDLVPLRYLVHLPPGAGTDKAKRWPAILFLHGAGERGDDLKLVEIHGPPKIVRTRRDFPFIVISPQCPRGTWWSIPHLNDLIGEVMAKYPIDPDRLYLTGLSMGGFGSWMLACEYPDRFAAVVPICGGGDPLDVERIKDVPVWVVHGGRDPVVPVREAKEMVAALRRIGGRVRFTVYPEAGHDSWTATYDDPRLYGWLLEQARGKPRQPRATTTGSKPDEVRGKEAKGVF